ncbi:hypothetical protein Nizo2726_0665 [Lactiplantibacillus plantarum]|nr:hypothetical protein Nizo2877_2044 [Lactiplantibacillus plantarum]KZE02962.1 hypothetical protein FBR6_0408 [Lactiplantibacillus plantarum]KZT87346.1 hypothetical protein Nizo2029_1681 [Lactiplantibacillus plantarum]KZU35955.1 hypothetical protein Nizo2726_0665 [Lactiplantibacillus plantarum]KZU69925.1 hypothetical protein Nizo2855_2772 [Lactiplantibacillus plantarum]
MPQKFYGFWGIVLVMCRANIVYGVSSEFQSINLNHRVSYD